jgi:hypothetical protein
MVDSNILTNGVLLNLKVIGRLADRADSKLSIKGNEPTINPRTKFDSVMRWLYGEGRDGTVEFIEKTLEAASDIVRLSISSGRLFSFLESSDVSVNQKRAAGEVVTLLSSISVEVTYAYKGIVALKNTYRTSVRIQAKLDLLLEKATRLVNAISEDICRLENMLKAPR